MKNNFIALKCPKCGHEWVYKGKSEWYTYCAMCRSLVSIKKHRIEKVTRKTPQLHNEIPLECHRCGHKWVYRGNSQWYAPCPICKIPVKIVGGKIDINRK